MKCKCSLDNNYEIIGLCNLCEFNNKVCAFGDESWNQIKLSNTLTIDDNKPSVKKILKVYLDIKITSNKIINTPKTDSLNMEGLALTGKKLLVSGTLSQRIIYTSHEDCTQTHSIKLKDNFNSYVIIDEYSDPQISKFCIYPFIENISLNILSDKNIYKTIDLFLFAHRIDLPISINNQFIFYNTPPNDPNSEIVRVSFDGTNRTLVATNTNTPFIDNEGSLLFLGLKNSRNTVSKAEGRVEAGQIGSDFSSKLNNQKFQLGDLIEISYPRADNVILLDYPSYGDEYGMNFLANRIFKITNTGVVPYILPNVVSLKSINNDIIFNLGFDILNKIFLAYAPSIALADPTSPMDKYFEIILKDSSLSQKYRTSITGNQDAITLTNNLYQMDFEYGDIIELSYKDGSKVEISRNPYPSSQKDSLDGTTSKSFRITQSGLVSL